MFDHGSHATDYTTEDHTDTRGVPIEIADADEEEADVQIKLTPRGAWHRKLIGVSRYADTITTACGESACGVGVREETYAGELCRKGCFSSFELAQSELTDTIPDNERRTRP